MQICQCLILLHLSAMTKQDRFLCSKTKQMPTACLQKISLVWMVVSISPTRQKLFPLPILSDAVNQEDKRLKIQDQCCWFASMHQRFLIICWCSDLSPRHVDQVTPCSGTSRSTNAQDAQVEVATPTPQDNCRINKSQCKGNAVSASQFQQVVPNLH